MQRTRRIRLQVSFCNYMTGNQYFLAITEPFSGASFAGSANLYCGCAGKEKLAKASTEERTPPARRPPHVSSYPKARGKEQRSPEQRLAGRDLGVGAPR